MRSSRHAPAKEGLRRQIGRFFYAAEVPFGLAVVRILLPLALLCAMLPRWPYARELYSTDGATAPLWITYGYATMLPELPGTVVVALFSALILFLVTSSLGWCTRFSLIASTVLYTYFNLVDAISTMTKYSVIGSHGLLLLSLSHCGAVWSVDSWLKGRRQKQRSWPGEPSRHQPVHSAWPRRLMQLLVGFVYFGAAITKMHTPEFFSGDQLQTWMITNVNFQNRLGEYLALQPAVLVGFAYIAIIWEVLFLFLAWRGWGRRCMLTIGVGFHVMTTLTLGLYIFPMVCISLYFAFLNEEDVRRLFRVLRRWRRRWATAGISPAARVPKTPVRLGVGDRIPSAGPFPLRLRARSWAAFGFIAFGTAAIGMAVEHQMDPYGLRRPQGPYELRVLDAEHVQDMLGPPQPVRPIDKFASFRVGTVLVGGVLANRRQEFRQGESLTVQCTLNTPHEDMWVECNLHDARDRIIHRAYQVVSREMLRCNFYYELPESLEPGEYDLVLLTAGQEVMRRRITLLPRSGKGGSAPGSERMLSPVAN